MLRNLEGIIGTDHRDVMHGSGIDNVLLGGKGDDDLAGFDGNDDLIGGDGNDGIWDGGGSDRVWGDAGNDTIHGQGGADTIYGGAGYDILTYQDSAAGSVIDLTNRKSTGIAAGALIYQIEEIIATRGDDTLFGNGNANLFRGNDGADEMAGGGGDDSLYGGYGSDTLIGGEGADLLDGGAGSDAASYERSGTGLAVNLSYSSRNTGEAAGDIFVDIEQLIGSDYNDSLTGTDSSNWLTGGAGADRLWGLAGADVLIGGSGNDTLDGGDGEDSLTGGAGNDTYITDGKDVITEAAGGGLDTVQSSAGYILAANLENLVVTGTAIYGIGNELANRLTGNAADNVLSGGAGNDTIAGGGGPDRIIGGGGTDLMQGGKGDGAADSFEFSAVSESAVGAARDIIEDFVSGSDRIHLGGIDADSTMAGDQAFLFSGATAKAHAVWYAKTAEGIILRADIDGNTTADFEVLLKGGTSITGADFIL